MINNNLTNLYKDILKNNQLIESGKLYNSLSIDVIVNNNEIVINVISLPYLIYLTKDYNLTKQFVNNIIFENEISLLLYQDTENIINNILNGKPNNIIDKQIIIKYNGI